MPNSIRFSESGPARTVYEGLSPDESQQVDDVLDYIRDVPFEHGAVVQRMYRPPVVLYVYDDGQWRISYGLSHRGAYYDIGIWNIARVEPDLPW